MNHLDRITICQQCVKKKFDFNKGVLCSLTNEKPTFIENCKDFSPNYERAHAVIAGRKIALKTDKEESTQHIKWGIISLISGILAIPILDGILVSWISLLVSATYLCWGLSRKLEHRKGDNAFLTKKE